MIAKKNPTSHWKAVWIAVVLLRVADERHLNNLTIAPVKDKGGGLGPAGRDGFCLSESRLCRPGTDCDPVIVSLPHPNA